MSLDLALVLVAGVLVLVGLYRVGRRNIAGWLAGWWP